MVKDNSFGIADLQDKMLGILKYFICVCEENNLRYWLAGGTCLGALRHKGFIPWDDDLDVYMPREDYEKLWRLLRRAKTNEKFRLCRTTKEHNYHHRVMQMVDITTTFVHSRCKNEDIEHGVYIDIIPIDACPNNRFQRLAQIVNAIIFSICNIQCKPEYNGGKMIGLMSLGTTILLRVIRSQEARYRVWKKAEARMRKYDINTCSHVKSTASLFKELLNPYPKEWFEGERKVEFEDIMACVPSKAEDYCALIYGDYMKLPPKEEQTVKHHTEFIDLNNPYSKYKGIYYLVK